MKNEEESMITENSTEETSSTEENSSPKGYLVDWNKSISLGTYNVLIDLETMTGKLVEYIPPSEEYQDEE